MKKSSTAAIGVGALALCLLLFALIYPSSQGFPERLRLQACRSLLDQVVAAEERHFRKYGEYVSAQPHPQGPVGEAPLIWDLTKDPAHGFNTLKFKPKGDVFCRVGVAASGDAFTAEMECDPTGSGDPVYMGFVKPSAGQREGLVGPFEKCSAAGVYAVNRPERGVVGLVGPCDARSSEILVVSVHAGKNSE